MHVSLLRFSVQDRRKVNAKFLRVIRAICPFPSAVLMLGACEFMEVY
jgi:hypothetical protein